MKRIFIAINLPEEVKESLVSFQDQWPDLPANWTKKENLHITLQFLGNVSDKELEKVIEKLTSAGKNHASFEGTLRNIVYGPTKSRPSMVWAFAEKSSSLAALQKDIQKNLSQIGFILEKQAFLPHLTLAKLRQFEFQRLEPEEWPLIEEDIALPFPVNSFDIMESSPKKDGAEYTVVASIPLAP